MPPHDIDQHKQADADGRFRRQDAQFRSTISKDGPFPPEKGRYIFTLLCFDLSVGMPDINCSQFKRSGERHWYPIVRSTTYLIRCLHHGI